MIPPLAQGPPSEPWNETASERRARLEAVAAAVATGSYLVGTDVVARSIIAMHSRGYPPSP